MVGRRRRRGNRGAPESTPSSTASMHATKPEGERQDGRPEPRQLHGHRTVRTRRRRPTYAHYVLLCSRGPACARAPCSVLRSCGVIACASAVHTIFPLSLSSLAQYNRRGVWPYLDSRTKQLHVDIIVSIFISILFPRPFSPRHHHHQHVIHQYIPRVGKKKSGGLCISTILFITIDECRYITIRVRLHILEQRIPFLFH